MFKLGQTIKSHVNLKPKITSIDNVVFKLHYRLTCWLLFAFAGIICVEEYNKQKIQCTHSDPTDSRKQLEHVINTFCFFLSTFTVPRHLNQTSGNKAYPGVGPSEDGEEVLTHWYYQWVPYVLFFQAICFYIPHYLWRVKEGGRMKDLVEGFNIVDMVTPEATTAVHENALKTFKDRIHSYRSWLGWLVACEVLNLINLIAQMCYTNRFLGGKFWELGSLVYDYYGSQEFSPLDMVFPKLAKCTFSKYGSSGSMQIHDVICVLSLNIINEKIFLVLWYWYFILLVPSIIILLHRVLSYILYSTKIHYNVGVFVSQLTHKPSTKDLLVLLRNLSYSEWFFLQCLATNLDGKLSRDLLANMAARYENPNVDDEESNLLSDGWITANIGKSSPPSLRAPKSD